MGYGGLIPFIVTALGARLDGARGLFWSHALAWIALLLPERPALMLLVVSLGALFWRDRRLVGTLALPGWYFAAAA